jgi:hypothetical protein
MILIPTVYDRVEDLPADEWKHVVSDANDLTMDLRLLGAFQSTTTNQCRCWFVIFRDQSGGPAAAACLAMFDVNPLETTRLGNALPKHLHFRVLFCGLPVPSGVSHLRWTPEVDLAQLADSLDELLRKLGRKHRARLVVVKELDVVQSDDLAQLQSLRYIRGEIPSAFELHHNFKSFDEYFHALQSGYRKQITRSQKRIARAGGSIEVVTGEQIAERFTDEVHALYLATRDRAKYRLETLPVEFFREVGRRFGDAASLTLVWLDGKIVGWTFGIFSGEEYHDLYIGIDYARNADADVYFNLYYHDLDRVFRRGCTCVHMGQTSDEFKTRLGAEPRELWFFVRATNGLVHAGLRRAARWVFPPVEHLPPRDIFLHAPQVKRQKSPHSQDSRADAGV